MATSPEFRALRTQSYFRTRWRYGGGTTSPIEQARFPVAEDTPGARETARKLCLAAKAIVESRNHRIHENEVYELILGAHAAKPGIPTLTKWAKTWAAERAPIDPNEIGEGEIQTDTLDDYVRIINKYVVPKLGHYLLTEIDEEMLKGWVAWLRAQRVRPSKANPDGHRISARMVQRTHNILHQLLGAAVGKWIEKNPASRPPGSRKSRLGLPKVRSYVGIGLEAWERDAIRRRCDPQMAQLWDVLCDTGLRLGEVLVLRVMDVVVDCDDPGIWVRRALKRNGRIGTPKSETSLRFVGVSTGTALLLAKLCVDKRPTALLFPSPKGKLWHERNLNKRHWRPAVAAAMRCREHPPALPAKPARGPRRAWHHDEVSTCACPGVLKRSVRIHDGRHTHAVDLIRAGWLPTEVQHRLGHASVSFTMAVYVHAWPSKYRKRLDELARERTGGGVVVGRFPKADEGEQLDLQELLLEDEAA